MFHTLIVLCKSNPDKVCDRQEFILQFEKAKDQEELNKAINSFQQSLRKNINAQNLKRFVKSFMK